jgi:hypothetical protein
LGVQEGTAVDALAEKSSATSANLRPPKRSSRDEMKNIDGFVQLLANFLRNYKVGLHSLSTA